MRRIKAAMMSVVLVLGLAPLVRAQIIYTNIGSTTAFTPSTGFSIGGSLHADFGFRFTAQDTLILDYADLALWGSVAGTPKINIGVFSDSVAGNVPGALLELTTFTLVPEAGGPRALARVEFSNTVLLQSGLNYWIAAAAFDNTTVGAWETVGISTSNWAYDFGEIGFSDPWSQPATGGAGGARIVGIPAAGAVPEPSTWGLIGSGLLMGLIAWRRHSGR